MALYALPKELTDWLRVTACVYICVYVCVCVLCIYIPADVNILAISSADQLDEGSLVPRCESLLLLIGA